jgi:hypothetical protein
MEELKRRMEVLLCTKPDAAIDESMREQTEVETKALSQKDRMANAGRRLISAAFSFLVEMFPREEETSQILRLTESIKARLSDSLNRNEDGKLQMTFTLPDESVLDDFARTIAKIVNTDLQNG